MNGGASTERCPMAQLPKIEVGGRFTEIGLRDIWQVERFLNDGVHVVMIRENEPGRRKTISVWALADRKRFVNSST